MSPEPATKEAEVADMLEAWVANVMHRKKDRQSHGDVARRIFLVRTQEDTMWTHQGTCRSNALTDNGTVNARCTGNGKGIRQHTEDRLDTEETEWHARG